MATTTIYILAMACLAVVCVANPTPGGWASKPKFVDSNQVQHASIQRRESNSDSERNRIRFLSCFSLKTNDSFPAAHIIGVLSKWSDTQQRSTTEPTNRDAADFHGYQSYWSCTESGAFVDGGMHFNQTNKKLYVPECGYYHVSSQMYFQVRPNQDEEFVNHRLLIKPNCDESENEIRINAFSSVGDTDKKARTSTYTAGVFHLCTGGQVYMYVPENRKAPCCPYGEETTTFLSAHLVRESTCSQPRSRMVCQSSEPTQEDYDGYYNGTLNTSCQYM